MTWYNPIPLTLVPTTDFESFRYMAPGETGLPLNPHPGAFAVQRKYHVHEGVDMYVPPGTPVCTVESGQVLDVRLFTGPNLGHEWWLNTYAVWVEGASGVVVYGEIEPCVSIGQQLIAGDQIGKVIPVLVKDKGRPTSMLHLELRESGNTDDIEWIDFDQQPAALRDPTPFLMCAGQAQ